MKELVEFLAKSLVNNPEEVSVAEVERDETTLLQLRVAPSDLGRVIGKEGRTAKAIRLLLAAAAARQGKKATLEILE